VFIACKPTGLPAGFVMSAVVIQELTAGAVDKSDIQRLDASRREHERIDIPTGVSTPEKAKTTITLDPSEFSA